MKPIAARCVRVERKTPLDPPGGDVFYEVEFAILCPGGTMTLTYCKCPKDRVGDVVEFSSRLCSEE